MRFTNSEVGRSGWEWKAPSSSLQVKSRPNFRRLRGCLPVQSWRSWFLAPDRQVWASGQFEGIYTLMEDRWQPVTDGGGSSFTGVSRFYEADDRTMWMASPVDRAVHTDGTTWMRYTVQNGLPGGRVMDICQDAAGQF